MAKKLTLQLIPSVFANFAGLCTPYLKETAETLVIFSRENVLVRFNMDAYFTVLRLCAFLVSHTGICAVDRVLMAVPF